MKGESWGGIPPTVLVAAGGVIVFVEVPVDVLMMVSVDTTVVILRVENEVTSTVVGAIVSLVEAVDKTEVTKLVIAVSV